MKKRRRRLSKKHKHHIKLGVLFASKLFLVVLSFFIGLVVGTLTNDIFATLLIAFGVGIGVYLLSVLHVIERLRF